MTWSLDSLDVVKNARGSFLLGAWLTQPFIFLSSLLNHNKPSVGSRETELNSFLYPSFWSLETISPTELFVLLEVEIVGNPSQEHTDSEANWPWKSCQTRESLSEGLITAQRWSPWKGLWMSGDKVKQTPESIIGTLSPCYLLPSHCSAPSSNIAPEEKLFDHPQALSNVWAWEIHLPSGSQSYGKVIGFLPFDPHSPIKTIILGLFPLKPPLPDFTWVHI